MSNEDPYEYDDPYEDFSDDFDKPIGEKSSDHDPVPYRSDPPPPPPAQTQRYPGHGPIAATQVQCSVCGYNLTGVPIGGNCPECGSSVNVSFYTSSTKPPVGKAITSMVLGICSVVLCCCPGVVLGIIGLIFGILSLQELPQDESAKGARGMAYAGIACSIVGLVLSGGYWMMAIFG